MTLTALANPKAESPLPSLLETIRAKYDLPSLAGAIFTTDGLVDMAAVGVRKAGSTIPVTTGDLWHLGSDTKVMTAMLAGTFVAEGKLSWDAKVVSFFPDIAERAPETLKQVTLDQLLRHRAGLIENLNWRDLSKSGSLMEQRLTAARMALSAPAYEAGTFHYANTGYVVVGAILEKISGKPWEELMQERIFKPLGMVSAGFGGLGTPGLIDQPWPHFASGVPVSINGPGIDNPEIMGPAGTVHCTMADWVKFLTDQLRGASGMKAYLPKNIYMPMQDSGRAGGEYGYGWLVLDRPWAGGKALSHSGFNTLNYCTCWLAPTKKFGILVCCNQGGDRAASACDDACNALIVYYLK